MEEEVCERPLLRDGGIGGRPSLLPRMLLLLLLLLLLSNC